MPNETVLEKVNLDDQTHYSMHFDNLSEGRKDEIISKEDGKELRGCWLGTAWPLCCRYATNSE
jgi:hypothetical protein